MEWMRSWLFSVAAAALISTLAVTLTPQGAPKKLAKLAGGLLLLIVMLEPVKTLRSGDISGVLAEYQRDYSRYAQAFTEENQALTKSIIEAQTAAYISDKATGLGLQITQTTVTCRLTEEGFPTPSRVYVQGRGPDDAWDALSAAITTDFGLDKEHQRLERMDPK